MRKFLTLFLILSTVCKAAIVSVCASGCTTTNLQTAFDSLAACGDSIQIKSTETQTGNFTITFRGCAFNPITVTSDRIAFFPSTAARVTPSQLGNMAHITTPNSSPALSDVLDGMGRPPSGWNFIGVAWTSSNAGSTFGLVYFNTYSATGPTQIANNITFDRNYFYRSPIYTGNDLQNAIRGDVTNITVKNCFFGDTFWNGIETHGFISVTNPGPVTLTNNFFITASIPIFTGGTVPTYPVYLPNGGTISYNYFWRPWKFNSDPLQPHAADYVAWASGTSTGGPFTITNISNTGLVTTSIPIGGLQGSLITIASVGGCTIANNSNWRINNAVGSTFQLLNFPGCNSTYTSGGTVNTSGLLPCNKNLGEMKYGTGFTWQYNVGENSWFGSQCGNQFNGFTDTIRTEWDSNVSGSNFGAVTMVDSTHITWAGTYRIGGSGANSTNTQDLGVCLQLTSTGVECHPITSFTGASLIASSPFSSVSVGSVNIWIAYAASAQLSNITISHNVWKNTDEDLSILSISPNNGTGNNGFGKNHTISQNLWYANSSYTLNESVYSIGAGEFPYNISIYNPVSYTLDHNTIYNPQGVQRFFVFFNSTQSAFQPKYNTSLITNNLFGTASLNGIPFGGDGAGDTSTATNSYMTNSQVENNALPGGINGGGGTGGNTVTGNIYTTWSDPFGGQASNGIFIVQPTSPYYHAGTDGQSLGADFTQLPMITGISITQFSGSVNLGFNLNSVNSDIKNTQPCVLEVSTSTNLQTDLGAYTVIPSLDPTMSIGADLSTQSGVTILGNRVTWPITGLTTGTPYYGRLQCYGDMEMFSFTATGGGGSTGSGTGVSGKVTINGVTVK